MIVTFYKSKYNLVRFDNNIRMSAEPNPKQPKSTTPNQMIDPLDETSYSFVDGGVSVQSSTSGEISTYYLPSHCSKQLKVKQNALRFKKNMGSPVVFSPSGKALTCKTDKIQQVDFNIAFAQGVAIWKLSCSSNCLSLIAGVRNVQKKKEHCFEFTVQYSTAITFKLDISGKRLIAWVDKNLSVTRKMVELTEDLVDWTPFIRVRGVGMSVFLSELVQDPENTISLYNVFGNINCSNFDAILNLGPLVREQTNTDDHTMKFIDLNTILVYSKHEVRVIRRTPGQRQFNFNWSYCSPEGEISVWFDEAEIEVLRKVGFKIEQNGNYASKRIEEWVKWMSSAFKMFDSHILLPQSSQALYLRAYEILLSKLQTFKAHINVDLKPSPALQSDIDASWGYNDSLFSCPVTAFQVPASVRLNNLPPLVFQKDIKEVLWTEHYLIVCMAESEKVVVVNREDSLFRLTQVNLRKGLKKQDQLSQYQRQLDQLHQNNPNEPSIYKILKNCLKYADKIKLPEKEKDKQKDKEKDKENKAQKKITKTDKNDKQKKGTIEIDPNLISQLTGMGFSEADSRKALIITKNDIEKAIDLLCTKKSSQQVFKVVEMIFSWSCTQCTFSNKDPNGTHCQMCNSPRVVNEEPKKTQVQPQQTKIVEEEKLQDDQIQSKNIEQPIKKIFVWELGFAYCPLVFVCVFENKLRVRLFGPNPKYYSLFYNKDEEFVDLTHLTIYDAAYKIDQKPVRSQFHNSMAQSEEKQCPLGWISLEDEDIEMADAGWANTATFRHCETSKEKVIFEISVLSKYDNTKRVSLFKGVIDIQKIYAEKRKSLSVKLVHSMDKQPMKQAQKDTETHIHPQGQQRTKINSTTIPKNGFLEQILSRRDAKQQSITIKEEVAQVHDKIHQTRLYLPVIAAFEHGSCQVATMSSILKAGQKPLILKNLNNNLMTVEHIVLEKVGNSPTVLKYKGVIYFSENPSKIPVNKVIFELEKGRKKYYIETNRLLASAFVTIELLPDQQYESQLIQEIALVGLIGEEVPKPPKKSNPKFHSITKLLTYSIKSDNDQYHHKTISIEAEVINSAYDLGAMSALQLEDTLDRLIKEGQVIDLRLLIHSSAEVELQLQSLILDGWDTVKSVSHWSNENSCRLLEQDFRQILQKLLQTADTSLVNSLIEEENKSYLKLLLQPQYNLTPFFTKYVIDQILPPPKRKKLFLFINEVVPYLPTISKSGNFNYRNILCQACKSKQIDAESFQFLLDITREFELQSELLVDDITKNLKQIKEKTEKEEGNMRDNEEITGEEYMGRGLKQKKINPIGYCRYFVQIGKLYRKYTIELVSLYKINRIILNFEKSIKKSGFKLVLKSYDEFGNSIIQFNQTYPEFVWEQLSICPYSQEFDKIVKESKRWSIFNCLTLPLTTEILSRFLQIQISFFSHPNIGSEKDIERCPQTQIIPEIEGEYRGESTYTLPLFKQIDLSQLIFVKNVGNLKKFNLKSANNLYCYEYSQVTGANKTLDDCRKNEEIKPSLIACAELDELIVRGGDQYSEKFMGVLIDALLHLERGALSQRIVLFMKKMAKSNVGMAGFIFKNKLPNEFTFNSILRNSALNGQHIVSILSHPPTPTELLHSTFFAKGKSEHLGELLSIILKHNLAEQRTQQTVILHQKHGWMSQTPQILDLAITQNKKQTFQGIIVTCTNNDQLVHYCQKLLKSGGMDKWFAVAFKELQAHSRTVTEEQFSELLGEITKYLIDILSQQNYDESQLLQNFSALTSAFNHLHPKKQGLVQQYIRVFSCIPNKEAAIGKFLTLRHFRNTEYIPQLLELILTMLSGYLAKNSDSLGQVYEILVFISRSEKQEELSVVKLKSDVFSSLCQIFSTMAIRYVCFGGEECTKIINIPQRFKLSVIAYLAGVIEKLSNEQSACPCLSQKCLNNLMKWLMLNTNVGEPEPQKPASNHFFKIEDVMWKLLVASSTEGLTLSLFKEEFQKQEAQVSKIRNPINKKLYERRLLNMSIRYLDKVEDKQICSGLLEFMFTKFMGVLISKERREIEGLTETSEVDKLIEAEFANSFELQQETQNKPKDWLLYKNGAKSSVYKFDYPKTMEKSHRILMKIKEDSAVSLTKIIIGFEQLQTAEENCCIPREICVEGGPKLQQLKFIGKMSQIPDTHYTSFSVRVFGLNCVEILAQKLASSLNKFPEVKYLRFTFKCPEQGFLPDLLKTSVNPSKAKNLLTFINFLSIQGNAREPKLHSELENVQAFIKRLSLLKHRESLRQLLGKKENIAVLNASLAPLTLMGKTGFDFDFEDANKLIMRVCEVNTEIGNKILEKYLSFPKLEKINGTVAQVVSQLILSDPQHIKPRVLILHQFINKLLDSQGKELKEMESFMGEFCNIVYIIQRSKKLHREQIKLTFNTNKLCSLIQSQNPSVILRKYICTVMTLKTPFSSSELNHTDILQALVEQSSFPLNSQTLEALVVSDPSSTSWFLANKTLETIYGKVVNNVKTNPENMVSLQCDLFTLASLSFNSLIKDIVNQSKYNIQILNLLLTQEYYGMLVKDKNTKLRESLTKFISNSVLGTSNERCVAEILKFELMKIGSEHNQYFIGEVFLPILNSFEKRTIYVVPYNRQQHKILLNFRLKNITQKPHQPNSSATAKSLNSKFRLPTSLLNANTKNELYDKLKTKCKLEGGNFNLVASHGNSASGMFGNIVQALTVSTQSMLILLKSTIESTKTEVLGMFYKQQTSARAMPLNWNQSCLMFTVRQNQNLNFVNCNRQINKKFISVYDNSVYDDENDEKTIEINYQSFPFCEIYSSNLYGESYIDLNTINGTSGAAYTLESAEYWLFEPMGPGSLSTVKTQGHKKQISLTNQILSLFSVSYLEPQLESKSVLRLLRYDKVYEIPSTFTIQKLKQSFEVMKCKVKESEMVNLIIKPLQVTCESSQNNLQIFFKKNIDTPVIDFIFEVNNLISILDSTSPIKNTVTSSFPKRGILQHFEEMGGVTSMIKAIKKSLQIWKNKERRQKWLQYVLQLQKFTTYPHFFGMYMKDSDTMDLLFKLLSGLPDTETDKKWDELQTKSTQKLLKIVGEILCRDTTTEFREYAMKHDFLKTILERLTNLTGQFKRQWKQVEIKEQTEISPNKRAEDDGVKEIKKKKGVGYGNDGSTNTKWIKGTTEAQVKKEFEVVELILNIIDNFLGLKGWEVPKQVIENIYQSSLLPYLQDSLRAGTLLQISKNPSKFKLVFRILKTMSSNPNLVQILMPLNKNYHPKQIEPLQSLIKSLENTSNIFLSCLKSNKELSSSDKISEDLAKDIIETSKQVERATENYIESHYEEVDSSDMKSILQLPFDEKYRYLLKDLRFDYIDMKQSNKIKHHYSSNFSVNYTPNQNKMIRLAQQLADISTSLPYEHTNSIFVRCDKDRVDFMQALIMGSNGTPYGHGAFLFDVYFDDAYPSSPPKVNLTTTGYGKVRFNPNLYSCGKVCLSLLGTWRGSASESWDPKVSTLLQVLVSTQAIIMSEEVYFNEPGFESEQGTPEGEKKNEAYSNIVRYCNIKFAMIQNMRNPPKGFENVIRRHFYLKQNEIMEECKKWLLYADKRPANYAGLVNDHNPSWCTQLKKSKTQYRDMLQKAIEELEQQFKKLAAPSIHDISSLSVQKRPKKKKETGDMLKKLEEEVQEEIDVEYEKKDTIDKQIDVNDEKVKDRWSRYIGAMGIDAVSRQSKADILVFGLGPTALEVVKNLVLSGCRKLTIVDDKVVRWEDLSGGFFFTEADVGKKRVESVMHKIKELNIYVKVDTLPVNSVTDDVIKTYHLVIVTEMSLKQQFTLNEKCRGLNIKFISAECRGAYFRMLNDFGDKFEVLDKNGQEPVQAIIKHITCEVNGIVTLIQGARHSFEDGEAIQIKNVEGMVHKEDNSKSINNTVHKVKVMNVYEFQIGDTSVYQPYIRNGTVKNIKEPVHVKFRSMREVFEGAKEKLPIDQNLQYYDFSKEGKNQLIHYCFGALDWFGQKRGGGLPAPWDAKDAEEMVEIFSKIYPHKITPEIRNYVSKFSFTCSGYLPPLCAFAGGLLSQEVIKAITQKYKPIDATFFMDVEQLIPQLPEQTASDKYLPSSNHRDSGFQVVAGRKLLSEIKNSTSFMIGSGAIGCELLKNFAMVGLGTGEKGKITLTDPDHIENSNLNRQFLFREKHISKPKSRTAAASILLMNPHLKGHVSALLQRVSQSTKCIFSNKFFESLTFAANALDNVAARRYVDQRCVENKIPLFQSGTLGPKGHTQVIIPFQTESYGSQNDPAEEGEIPHCTLKLFPEETLHCIEWALDIFGKKFSLQPKAFNKIKDPNFKPEKDDIKSLNDCIVMATKGPLNFEDCIVYSIGKFYKYFRNDIMQLLYTYPLDSKTKDGEPFWKLPKRPPTPIFHFNSENLLHCSFISSMAVLLAKIYGIPFPKNFREEKEKLLFGKQAGKVKVEIFVASEEKAKQILKEAAEKKKESKDEQDLEEKQVQMSKSDKSEMELYQTFMKSSEKIKMEPEEFEKDNDQNGHIDFIHSLANLRAINYKLDAMDWMTTKLKAGRIVPALSTTTTCVAGLQTLEICKYIRKLKIESMRNSFLNLAVPSLQMSQPGCVKKLKLSEKVEVNLWDRWEVPCSGDTTFGDVYSYLEGKYQFHPIGVLQGMSRIDTAKTAQGKKDFLGSKVLDRLDKEDNYIDIVVLFTKNEQDEKLIGNIPTVRLKFQG